MKIDELKEGLTVYRVCDGETVQCSVMQVNTMLETVLLECKAHPAHVRYVTIPISHVYDWEQACGIVKFVKNYEKRLGKNAK